MFNVNDYLEPKDVDYTAAVTRAAAAALSKGCGRVYFPETPGSYTVGTLTLPDAPYGWLEFEFDGRLIANTIYPGSNNAFIGHGMSGFGLAGPFAKGPAASWQQPQNNYQTPLIDIVGKHGLYFEGINAFCPYNSAVRLRGAADGNGCVYTQFRRCLMGSYSTGWPVFSVTAGAAPGAGFGLHLEDVSIDCPGGASPYALDIHKFGMIRLKGCYVGGSGIHLDASSDFIWDGGGLAENLNGKDLIFAENGCQDLVLIGISNADSQNSHYLKVLNPGGEVTNVTLIGLPATTVSNNMILNPASTPQSVSVFAVGWNTLGIPEWPMMNGAIFNPKYPAKFYGSKYVKPPLTQNQGS